MNVRIYFKKLPFHLDERAIRRVRIAGQCLGIIILTAVISYTLLHNLAPLGVKAEYGLNREDKNISGLGPSNRVTGEKHNGQIIFRQKDDLVYFTTKMPYQFESATVRLTFQNPHPDQTIALGFQDQEKWHYATKPYDIPFLNSLDWQRNGQDPVVLYQREPHYGSVDEFMKHPPQDAIIGTYAYDIPLGNVSHTKLSDYQPTPQETIITTPLRGKHILYVYLHQEPFTMSIQKQDLNWYEDPDVMQVKIYKDKELVHQITAEDDGIKDASRKVLPPQEITIKNPGKELPESGIYKIILDANNDTLIKQITTNLHKIVFAGSVYPANNNEVYPEAITEVAATTLYTNALSLSAMTYHKEGKQTLLIGNQILPLTAVNMDHTLTPQEGLTQITLPKNDVILNAFQGYFAFDKDHFFLPTTYHILPMNKKDDVKLVDYVLANYLPPITNDSWQVQERFFNLRSAFINNERLSWVIKAPTLKKNNHEIIIKDITITFHKKSWL